LTLIFTWLYDVEHRVTAISGSLPAQRLEQHFSGSGGAAVPP